MKQEGYLIITDISGYTEFLTQSELEHAHDILENLFRTLIGNIQPPLEIAKLEGDAIFAFSRTGTFVQGQTLLESLERLYFIFRNTLETMRINTTCTCTACRMMPSLDLKFVLHAGEFILASMAGREELSGPDVILVHRLLKNTIAETTGTKAYVFITEAAAEAMKIGDVTESMIRHTEHYEHIGDVTGFVHDLKPVYERIRELQNIVVEPGNEWFIETIDIAAPPSLVWDYLNEPNRRAQWLGVPGVFVTQHRGGRVGVGSVQHCAHGKSETPFTILDWRPFEYVTHEIPAMLGKGRVRMTTRLMPIENGTRVAVTWSTVQGDSAMSTPMLRVMNAPMRGMLQKEVQKSQARLKGLLEGDAEAGLIVCTFTPTLSPLPPSA